MAPAAFGPGYPAPSSDNGWVKWVAAAAALIVVITLGAGVAGFLLFRSSGHRSAKVDGGSSMGSDAHWSDANIPAAAANGRLAVFALSQCGRDQV